MTVSSSISSFISAATPIIQQIVALEPTIEQAVSTGAALYSTINSMISTGADPTGEQWAALIAQRDAAVAAVQAKANPQTTAA